MSVKSKSNKTAFGSTTMKNFTDLLQVKKIVSLNDMENLEELTAEVGNNTFFASSPFVLIASTPNGSAKRDSEGKPFSLSGLNP